MTSRKGTFGEYVTIDPVKLSAYLRDPDKGPIARKLIEAGEIVKLGAQRRVGVHKPDPGDPFASRRLRRPGTLRDSIVKRLAQGPDGMPMVLVGSDDPIALLHHEGTAAHAIAARRAPYLVFWSRKQQRVVRALAVVHPGTRPNRYLVDALEDLRGRT